jgi:DNA-directed RNA polymerase subunit E'/Rpb7
MNRENKEYKIYEPYIVSVLETRIFLSITEVGDGLKKNLEDMVSYRNEGKCIPQGYIKPGSVKIMTFSAGKVNGDRIEYKVVYQCEVCFPVEGMLIECTCKTVTKAGIHAEVADSNGNVPLVVFVARDHHINHSLFESAEEKARMVVKVVGARFELNDANICVIGSLEKIL